jgi:hypothetical protein
MIDRYEIERKLARVLSKDLRVELDKLLNYLGDPPNFANVPYEYWQNGWKDIQADVEPVLMEAFLESAEEVMLRFEFGVDWDAVNTDAANWARAHSESILSDLFNRRYDFVNESVARYFEESWTISDLAERLRKWYDPVRAEMIAITETTRAVVEGERAIIRNLERESGQAMIPIWMTANDERVCPICSPRDNQVITDGIYPPAHPRCRCVVGYELPTKERD